MTEAENSGESAGPVLVPQAHGGALLSGGKPGNRGGGRPKAAIRADLLRILDEYGIPHAEAVLAGQDEERKDRILKDLLQHALGPEKELTVATVQEMLGETVRIIREELPAAEAERVLGRIRGVWR